MGAAFPFGGTGCEPFLRTESDPPHQPDRCRGQGSAIHLDSRLSPARWSCWLGLAPLDFFWVIRTPACGLCLWRGARAADWAGLENRCGGNVTEGSNPSLSALKFDTDSCNLRPESAFFSGFLAFSILLLSSLLRSSSVQSGAESDASGASRTAPFSAPLGTTGGTFLGPSVPVARNARAPDSVSPSAVIGGSDARAEA